MTLKFRHEGDGHVAAALMLRIGGFARLTMTKRNVYVENPVVSTS